MLSRTLRHAIIETIHIIDDFGEDGFAVGIGIGVVAVVLLAVILVGFLVMRHKSEKGGGGGGLFRGRKLTADNTFFQISFKQKSTAIPIRYFRQGYNQVWMKKYDESFPIREWMRDGRIPAKDEYNRLTNVDYRTNVLTKSKAEAARVNRTFGSGLNRLDLLNSSFSKDVFPAIIFLDTPTSCRTTTAA